MKKIITVLFCLSLVFALSFSVSADNNHDARVVDGADILTTSEEQELTLLLDEISERQQFEVVVCTTYGTNGQHIRDFADDFYDYNSYGYGSNYDGCILVVDMLGRDWWISTCGYGITAFTDAGIDYIGEQIEGDLSNEYYYDAFASFAKFSDDFVTQAKTGAAYDSGNLPKAPFPFFIALIICLIIGFAVAFIATAIMKGKLKSVRYQAAAKDYLVSGSMKVTESRDIFLYRNVTRRAKPKESSGSSTHTSSSGRSHGGGGGSF